MKTKLYSLFIAFVASMGTMFAESGTCGAYLTWDLTNRALTISGTGDMTDFDWKGAPWYSYREDIKSVIIENSVTSIGNKAFNSCTEITSVTIGNSITRIGNWAFGFCSSLTSVTIPNSVQSIEHDAFSDCYGLTSVTIGNSVTSIEVNAFISCSSLTEINVATDNPNYCSVDGVLFNKKKTILIQYAGGKSGVYTTPNSVTSIGNGAFFQCQKLTSIEIPNSVKSIGEYAFSSCIGLTSVSIPNSVKSIGNRAFLSCTGLTSVTIPNSVTSIEYEAFYNCKKLTSVTIPNSITIIGNYAFYGCSGLTSITCEAVTPPSCDDEVFNNVDKSIPVYVPANSVDAYKKADQWKDFGENIQPIQAAESTVTEIEAKPTANSAVVEWPAATGATIYIIEIWKGKKLICSLYFNEKGQLLVLAIYPAPDRNGKHQAQTATQIATGWQYTIEGLDPDTEYSYTVVAKKDESDTTPLYTKTISFKTKDTETALESVTNDQLPMTNKIIKDGQLLILRDGKTYTITGAEVIVQ